MPEKREPAVEPAGGKKTLKQAVLQAGAELLQTNAPLKSFDIYEVGYHCGKHDPHMQMEAHHFCTQVNADFIQCVLFDGSTADANLIGVEYIISEKLFHTLPEGERGYWHPHNYEILSGVLIAPGLPTVAENAMLALLMNSYGKTWHTWHTGRHDGRGQPGHSLPLGDPMLMWSFNRDGEMDDSLKASGEQDLGLKFDQKRQARTHLTELAKPQSGVDDLKSHFPNARPIPGVEDAGSK